MKALCAIIFPILQRRKWRCCFEQEPNTPVPAMLTELLLQCFQRLPTGLRINPQTSSSHSHFPSLCTPAFPHFLYYNLLSPAPGPLHVLCPLCEIVPTHLSRLKPAHPLSPKLHLLREVLLLLRHPPQSGHTTQQNTPPPAPPP